MSGSRGTGTPHRPKTAALSRHWKMAVLAAAGFATMVSTTTVVAVTDAGAAETHPATAVTNSGKSKVAPPAAPARDGVDADAESQDGDYWAEHAGNPGPNDGGKGDDRSGSKGEADKEGKGDSGDKRGKGGKENRSASKEGKDGKEKGSASKGDEGKEKGSASKGDEGNEKYSGDRGDHDEKHDYKRHHRDHDKTFVECDPNELIVAIIDANQDSGGDLYLAEDCTYTLTVNQDGNGLPRIIQPITIHGNGATIARAANADQFRLFEVGAGGDLKLSDLTLTRGKTAEGQEGGAVNVNSAGRLDLDHVTVTNNTVDDIEDDDAGGIYNAGVTTIRSSTFSRNAGEDGSALFNDGGKVEISGSKFTRNVTDASDGLGTIRNFAGSLKISKSLISHNTTDEGGGVYVDEGVAEIERSAIVHNVAASTGGGVFLEGQGSLHVRHSTISDNVGTSGGGGLDLEGSAVIEDSKVDDNTTTQNEAPGGGIFVALQQEDAEVAIRDSTVSGNQAPGNDSVGGGIFVSEGSTLTLTDVKVTENLSDEPAGGIQNNGTVNTNGKIRIIDNVPTNCDGSAQPVPNCFG
ncbi:hypothetical protein ACFU5O_22655 [Streptomyces sp. NPDC057445]|uniref:hypothetical protein n=1 Tax=Streptomyces sp. NPDC057445 TaxID=3346136 RepID=UPI003685A134